MMDDFVPGRTHKQEWQALLLAEMTGLQINRSSRFGWVEAYLLEGSNGAYRYSVLAGRPGCPSTFRAQLRGCDCESPSCPHPAKFGCNRPAHGYGNEALTGRRQLVLCKCHGVPASAGVVAPGSPAEQRWTVPARGECPGYGGARPIDVLAFAAAVLATFKPSPARPWVGPSSTARIPYVPGYVPVYALANGATQA